MCDRNESSRRLAIVNACVTAISLAMLLAVLLMPTPSFVLGSGTSNSRFASAISPIKTVFLIVMENKNWSSILGNASAPYINGTLLPKASYATQY